MLSINPNTKVFLCSQTVDMKYSFDALAGLVTTHFGVSALSGHIFVFFNRRRDRVKLLCWESDGFGLYYKRLEHGTFSWVQDLDLDDGGEIQASDFAMILAGINPRTEVQTKTNVRKVIPRVAPLTLV